MTEYIEVGKSEFQSRITSFTRCEKIRFSSPVRQNYYKGDELIGYEYDSYGKEFPATYHVKELTNERD
tara:strand:- start:29 stop:232 length:204 start_codon:yes stop_codon:yes gene_type:complete